MKQRHPPGPAGTSCLTCKRRHKKCDQGQPACERCIKGGYECLGYSHIQRRAAVTGAGSSSSRAPPVEESVPLQFSSLESVELRNTIGSTSINQGSNELPEFSYHLMTPEISTHGLIVPSPNSSLGAYGLGLRFNTPRDVARTRSIGDPWLQLLLTNNQSWERGSSPPSSPVSSEPKSQPNASPAHILSYLRPSMEPRIARNLSTLSPDARQAIILALSQNERVLRMVHFTPKRQQIMYFRKVVVNRLQASSITRCAVFIGTNIVQSCVDRTTSDRRASLSKSVEQFERKLLLISSQTTDPSEVQNCLLAFLQVTFLKIVWSSGLLARQLRNVAPMFLQIVHSDPTLWPNPRGPPAASLAHVISSTRYELSQFVLMDITYAMVYGLPQIVEYDTSVPAIDNDNNVHPAQNFHVCPPEFQICLAEINLRCSRGYISHDWHLIERRLLSYKPDLNHTEDVESWKVVAQLAVVETWRQVLLIYLYMAVCGVASDDPRVQSAVQQIFQLFKTVPHQDPPRMYPHFMFQYVIAGACTRSEKQRAYARRKLLDPDESVLWLLPGSEFVPVLDHLWHGAAANGRAFKWSDYIFSRHTVLPAPV